MKQAVIYIHGKGGSAAEAAHYKPLFPGFDVIGFDYSADTPWDAKKEFTAYFDTICAHFDTVYIAANSIGAFFAMNARTNEKIKQAYFISPVIDMARLISDMMAWANVTEDQLRKQKEIETPFGETLSWEYLSYVRSNPVSWNVPTHILYGENDHLVAFDTVSLFAGEIGAAVHVMPSGEHWFHTKEQMEYLDDWIVLSRREA